MNVNKNRIVLTIILGVSVFAVMHLQLFFPIVGTDVGTDPREIFLIFGAVLSNIPGVIIIAFLSGI